MNYNHFIAVTNRHLCKKREYLQQIQYIAQLHPKAIVLREKDLPLDDYISLAKKVLEICKKEDTMLILHNYAQAANVLHHPYIHLPISILSDNTFISDKKNDHLQLSIHSTTLGTSVHSVEDAIFAQNFGCNYIFAGNIYETNCKPGLAGKGLHFLKNVVDAVDIPVYAIGGICSDNIDEVLSTGAAGGCMMSGFMEC